MMVKSTVIRIDDDVWQRIESEARSTGLVFATVGNVMKAMLGLPFKPSRNQPLTLRLYRGGSPTMSLHNFPTRVPKGQMTVDFTTERDTAEMFAKEYRSRLYYLDLPVGIASQYQGGEGLDTVYGLPRGLASQAHRLGKRGSKESK